MLVNHFVSTVLSLQLCALASPVPENIIQLTVNLPTTTVETHVVVHVSCGGWQETVEMTCVHECVQSITVPDDAHCVADATSNDLWAPREHFATYPAPSEIVFEMTHAGRITGQLRLPRGTNLPDQLSVAFQKLKSPQSVVTLQTKGKNASRCVVHEDGSFSCTVPEGQLDLKLRVPGYASRYFWQVSVPRGHLVDLGKLSLIPGSSVAGWVFLDGDDADLEQTEVFLQRPELVGGDPEDTRARGAFLAEKQNPNSRGFFHFEGLTAGKYQLIGTHRGFASVSSPVVNLEEGVEAALREPMMLIRAIDTEVAISPPHDAWGYPWQVRLFSKNQQSFTQDPAGVTVDELTGGATIPGVAPGDYWLEISDSKSNHWIDEDVLVYSGMPPIEVSADFLMVEGHISVGDKPIAAWLEFSSRGRSIRFSSDSEGRFEGALPESGEWEVQVSLHDQQKIEVLDGVEVPPPSSLGFSRVDIELPGLSVEGRVVNEQGDAVAKASVFAQVEVTPADHAATTPIDTQTLTGVDGKFRLVGLPAGRLTTYSRKGGSTSDSVLVLLSDGIDNPPITLTLQEEHIVVGTILGPAGPISSANVIVVPVFQSNVGLARVVPSVSGVDGRFEVRVPAWATEVDLVVLPPGYTAFFKRIEIQDDREIAVPIEDRGGELRLRWVSSSGADVDVASLQRPRFFYGNMPLLEPVLRNWAGYNPGGFWDSDSGRATIPGMPAGEYSICSATETGELSKCESGSLEQFGVLTLELR